MTKKNIGLVITLLFVVGAIWYLEGIQAHPGVGTSATVQPINVTASGTVAGATMPTAVSSTETLSKSQSVNSGTATQAEIKAALMALAQSDAQAGYQPAIEIANPTGFINASSSFRLANLIGKQVILLDFWTYSCINCIRTLPYLTAWDAKYRSAGLTLVGIHTPEFDFEKNITNVQAAVQKYGIHYPVVLDSDYGTWTAYGNLYWPHEYLIDMAGYIVHDQVGEGNYDETEAEIQKLLNQRDQILGITTPVPTGTVNVNAVVPTAGATSQETYFGSARNEFLADGTQGVNGTQTLTPPQTFASDQLYLGGDWNFMDQYATNVNAGATIIYQYQANKVYFVASAPNGATIKVLQDGQPISAAAAGSDVHNGILTVRASQLYNIVNNGASGAEQHTLELIIESPGLEAFTFTFG